MAVDIRSKSDRPCLLDIAFAKSDDGFAVHQFPTVAGIEPASRAVALVGPKLHALIALLPRKLHALRKHPAPQPGPASVSGQQKQPKLGGSVVQLHTEDRSKTDIAKTRNPPGFAVGIMVRQKCVNDLGNQHAKAVIKPFFARIMVLVLCHQPVAVCWRKTPDFDIIHNNQHATPLPCVSTPAALPLRPIKMETAMGIDTERDIEANLQIGPTELGMVRLFIEATGGIEIPMDFTPDEAVEIAEEIMAAAHRAGRGKGKGKR